MNEPQTQILSMLHMRILTLLQRRQEQLKKEDVSVLAKQPEGTVMVHPNISQAEMQVMAQVAQDDPPDTFLFASNQTEMSKAQDQLVAWAERRVAGLQKEVKDAQTNLDHAKKMKWKKATFESIVDRAKRKLTFYEKVLLALKAGYTMVPDMNVELFAIRTVRKSAKKNEAKGKYANVADQKTTCSPAGEGRYVTPSGEQVQATKVVKHDVGKLPEYETFNWAEAHDEEIDFPFKMARPQILTATSRAMQEKVFDEMGCLPRFRVQADPVIVGRIVHREGYHVRRFNFLVVWFIDTKEL